MNRTFSPYLFRGQGAMITADSLLRPFADENGVVSSTSGPFANSFATHETLRPTRGAPQGLDLKDFGNRVLSVFLRWQVNPGVGLPSEPFKVWRRVAFPLLQDPEPVLTSRIALPPLGVVHQFTEPVMSMTVHVKSTGPALGVTIVPLANGVGFENMLGFETLNIPANGQRTFRFYAPFITAVLVGGADGQEVSAVGEALSQAEKIEGWELVETVGLPVDQGEFSDLDGQEHGKEQGLVGAEVPAQEAAKQRFTRGINPFGWYPDFPTGEMAPTWELPDPDGMIDDANKTLLDMLHKAMQARPNQQAEVLDHHVISPPQNANGDTMPADDGEARISSVKLMQMAVATDPMQSVLMGFGTGYPYVDLDPINLGAISLLGSSDMADYDFMVTGLWNRGLDGDSEPLELATIIPRPRRVERPLPPTDLRLHFLAHQRPAAPDEDWTATSRASWERLPLDNFNAVSSFAFGRAEGGVAGPATPLMEPRPSGKGLMPIGNNENRQDPEYPRQSASDTGYVIPNTPGSVSAQYGLANQNLFGIWSPWSTLPFSTTQPEPDTVNIISAELRPIDTGSGTVCPADLVVEFVVDWRVRSVARIDFAGRLFPAATRHEEPPAGLPGGLQKSIGGAAQNVFIDFAGDVPSLNDPSVPGLDGTANVISLDAQGDAEVATPGFASQGHARRYRVTIPGFSLDYNGTPHVGLAMRARLREALAPGRVGSFGPRSKLTYASDPRSRPTQVIDVVRLASLPDAKGECHAIVEWQSVPGADGYILYQSTETRMLASRSIPEALPGVTLSSRLTTLKNAFAASPDRRDFNRANKTFLTGTSLDVALPRGSQAIHLFVVIPVSAGGVEGPWPSGPDADEAMIPFVAPRIATPAPPTIEAQRIETPSGFAARIRVETRASSGARPGRIDLYRTRVADAARQIDSMGPSLVSLTGSTVDWMVGTDTNGTETWITDITGEDAPGGSWKPQWYRAIAWGLDDAQRGVRKGRGRPSPAVPVVIPPNDPPQLTPPVLTWPGGGNLGDILVSMASDAPITPTGLGPHTLSAEVRLDGASQLHYYTIGPDAGEDPLNPGQKQPGPTPLELIPEVPEMTQTALWRAPDGLDRNYRLFIRRPGTMPAGSIMLRMTDPLGRVTERAVSFGEGSIIPLPDLSEVDSFSISGRGTVFSVTTDAPVSGPLEYLVRIVIRPTSGRGGVLGSDRFRDLRELPGGFGRFGGLPDDTPDPNPGFRLPRRFEPRPGPILDLGTNRPASQFKTEGRNLVYEAPIAEVPLARTRPGAGAQDPMYIANRQKIGARTGITVFARTDIRSITFEIITPDGRRVSSSDRD
ncbi:hypothetical protein GCM10007385_38880 [Tateyamaria omphalii]|uniref:hypothetical protein n=1 Tax=Tateyamaria omphalii TaxID=299262 RepID=UPI00167ACA69|nr:hypothetical protein [Tateyamaria omphalii]GGX65927.1 hypothetical protein GCM10007385_38880 [Tateyamaria omphalii]